MAPCADFAVTGDLADNEVKGQIRPFFLIFRTGPPYSRPYDTLDETTKASGLVQSSWEDPWRHRPPWLRCRGMPVATIRLCCSCSATQTCSRLLTTAGLSAPKSLSGNFRKPVSV